MRLYLLAALTLVLAASTGCRSVNMCKDCGGKHHGMLGHHGGHGGGAYAGGVPHGMPGYKPGPHHREYIGPQGPPTNGIVCTIVLSCRSPAATTATMPARAARRATHRSG